MDTAIKAEWYDLDDADIAAIGAVASMQPYHVVDDGRWAEGRIGASRCRSSYAFRSLLDAGAVLAVIIVAAGVSARA